MNFDSFVDELVKASASLKASQHQKVRSGKMPIRAHNLLKKQGVDGEAVKKLLSKVWANRKPLALAAGSIAAFETGKKNLEALRIGHAIQSQQEG